MNKLIKAGQHLLSCDKLRAISLTPSPAQELKKRIPNPFRSEHALLTITYDDQQEFEIPLPKFDWLAWEPFNAVASKLIQHLISFLKAETEDVNPVFDVEENITEYLKRMQIYPPVENPDLTT